VGTRVTDRDLRESERQAATGGVRERAAWLRKRIKVGELTRDRVELAAFLGDEAARASLPCRSAGSWQIADRYSMNRWLLRLSYWGLEAMVRAALSAGLFALPLWEREEGWEWGEGDQFHRLRPDEVDYYQALSLVVRPRRALTSVGMWLLCPCDEHQQHMWTMETEASPYGIGGRWPFWMAPSAITRERRPDVILFDGIESAAGFACDCNDSSPHSRGGASCSGSARIQAAIRKDLLLWASTPLSSVGQNNES